MDDTPYLPRTMKTRDAFRVLLCSGLPPDQATCYLVQDRSPGVLKRLSDALPRKTNHRHRQDYQLCPQERSGSMRRVCGNRDLASKVIHISIFFVIPLAGDLIEDRLGLRALIAQRPGRLAEELAMQGADVVGSLEG